MGETLVLWDEITVFGYIIFILYVIEQDQRYFLPVDAAKDRHH